MNTKPKIIAFQGAPGAYSDLACRSVYPSVQTLPRATFEAAFDAVQRGDADLAMIPVDNSIAGRVADVHHLLPAHDLFIIGEHFQPVHHNLLTLNGAAARDLTHIHSHVHALPQCRKFLSTLKAEPVVHSDTAGAAAFIAQSQNPSQGAIASSLAAEIYDLQIASENIQDKATNITRFLILSPEPFTPPAESSAIVSLIFTVRNIPAALYKALGGFATNNLSLTKLESYVGPGFQSAQFYCEVLGHPDQMPTR